MTRTGRTFDQYLAEYVSTAPAEELELFKQHSEYYQLASEQLEMPDGAGGEMRAVEIVTVCEHGWVESHASVPAEGDAMHAGVWPICPGGSRRALAPGEFVLVEKVDGKWPLTNRAFDAIEDALIRETGHASMRQIETVVETYLDALAEGEQ